MGIAERSSIRNMSSAYGLYENSVPFRDSGWPQADAEAARAFWAWHEALASPIAPELDGADLTAFFEAQRQAVLVDGDVSLVSPAVWRSVRPYANTTRRRTWLSDQVAAAQILSQGDVVFANRQELKSFIEVRAVPHALLLADLANASRDFQRDRVEALAEGFFLHSRLVNTRDDVKSGRVYTPVDELEANDVSVDELVSSPASKQVRKVVWRRMVWIRDAFARGMPLAEEISRPLARELRTSVLLSLEILNQIERNGYDVAGFEPGLSRFHRMQARIQARFGRTTWY